MFWTTQGSDKSDSVAFMRRSRSLKNASLSSQEAGPLLYKKKNVYISYTFFLNQRLPILPGGLPPSTFGVCGLNCCVRHGNRWIPAAVATEFPKGPCPYNCIKRTSLTSLRSVFSLNLLKSSPRSISTGPLRASLHFHSRPIYQVGFMGPYLLSQ